MTQIYNNGPTDQEIEEMNARDLAIGDVVIAGKDPNGKDILQETAKGKMKMALRLFEWVIDSTDARRRDFSTIEVEMLKRYIKMLTNIVENTDTRVADNRKYEFTQKVIDYVRSKRHSMSNASASWDVNEDYRRVFTVWLEGDGQYAITLVPATKDADPDNVIDWWQVDRFEKQASEDKPEARP
jgi:hypothetical protein